MDPITIIVTALVVGAAAGLKPTAEQAVKDAYAGLKALITRKYAQATGSIGQLEAAPDSKPRQSVVKEDLGKTSAAQDPELLQQAKAVLDTVQAHDPAAVATVGVTIEHVKGASLRLAEIIASGPGPVTGVSVKDAEFTGDIEIKGVRAESGTPPKA